MTWCIIDIETNGLSKHRGKITEIAIYKHDGKKIVDEYQSLINPEAPIPYEISRLTGITNQMVKEAPKFYEIAKEIIEITEGSTFVAHNVNFDYGFVQEEFKRLGFEFKRKKLCTVRQSKVLIPGHTSYSLGRLCKALGIALNNRHRAAGDALATVKLFELLYSKDKDLGSKIDPKEQLSNYLHPKLDLEKVLSIPRETGVYYLYNAEGKIIYIGKSVNLRTRLFNHLRQPKTTKAIRMHNEVADISYDITGSELIALLKESEEIKLFQPKYNVAQKRPLFNFGIVQERDLFGYILLKAVKLISDQKPISQHKSLAEAKRSLEFMIEENQLCRGLSGLNKCNRGCVYQSVQQCKGAAICEEEATDYNIRVKEAISNVGFIQKNLLLIEKSSDLRQKHAILLEKGRYKGYGIFEEEFVSKTEDILDSIEVKRDNPDVRGIITSFLRKGKVKKVLEL